MTEKGPDYWFWFLVTRFEIVRSHRDLLQDHIAPSDRQKQGRKDAEHLLETIGAEFPEDVPLSYHFVMGADPRRSI